MTPLRTAVTAIVVSILTAGAHAQPTTSYIDLPEGMVFPEGIASDDHGSLYLTVFGSGAILRFDQEGSPEVFMAPGKDGLAAPVGVAVDNERDRLWVSSINPETFMSKLHLVELSSGKMLASLEAPLETGPHFFNEIVIDSDGGVYISDTLQPRIWFADAQLAGLTQFIVDPLLTNPDPNRSLGLNGLAMTPDGEYLIASVMDRLSQGGGRLVRVNLSAKTVDEIVLAGDLAEFGGSDGMVFDSTGRLLMVNITPPAALALASFTKDYSHAILTSRPAADNVVDRPSSLAISDDRLWIVNSQLDHVLDDGNGAIGTPPSMPFQIVGVPAADVLAE